jgi:hypothetical protein
MAASPSEETSTIFLKSRYGGAYVIGIHLGVVDGNLSDPITLGHAALHIGK